jgi:hypothetical protein
MAHGDVRRQRPQEYVNDARLIHGTAPRLDDLNSLIDG